MEIKGSVTIVVRTPVTLRAIPMVLSQVHESEGPLGVVQLVVGQETVLLDQEAIARLLAGLAELGVPVGPDAAHLSPAYPVVVPFVGYPGQVVADPNYVPQSGHSYPEVKLPRGVVVADPNVVDVAARSNAEVATQVAREMRRGVNPANIVVPATVPGPVEFPGPGPVMQVDGQVVAVPRGGQYPDPGYPAAPVVPVESFGARDATPAEVAALDKAEEDAADAKVAAKRASRR